MSENAAAQHKRVTPGQVVSFVFGVAIAVAIFRFVIPRFADYGQAWQVLGGLGRAEDAVLLGATAVHLYACWRANQAALIGLRLWPAAVVTQTSTTVANTMPAGGALAVGVTAAQLGSWGFTAGEIALYVGVTGLWNALVKLALPSAALLLLVVTEDVPPKLAVAAAAGAVLFAAAIGLVALVLRKESVARSLGDHAGRVVNRLRRLVHKAPVEDPGDRAVRWRRETLVLATRRWRRLTVTTLAAQLSLFLVLLLSLRFVGVSSAEVSVSEVFAVFTFARMTSALPITPGGVGVIDLVYVSGLSAAGTAPQAEIVAAVLIFRALTYVAQIPIGAVTYVVWRANTSWRRDTPPPGSIADELAYESSSGAAVPAGA
jgi:uncharacterized membrane protein YbhN (UPF0104 family)